jgi:hypothetical protein
MALAGGEELGLIIVRPCPLGRRPQQMLAIRSNSSRMFLSTVALLSLPHTLCCAGKSSRY